MGAKILLETGTNEIEIMEFTIDGELYGINVAKVKEIMVSDYVKPMPHSPKAVEGIFQSRDMLLTVVDLPQYLTRKETEKSSRDLFLVTNFNQMFIAFRVEAVKGISRISWEAIQKPDKTLSNSEESVITGIAEYKGKLVTILDFEKIVTDLVPEVGIQMSTIDELGERSIRTSRILVAEDSILLMKMIEESLVKAGYIHLEKFQNGQELYKYISSMSEEEVKEKVGLVITDIEMPMMDGHHLTKLIKSDPKFSHVPVVIFSSLINESMIQKGKSVGADEQISKPEIKYLVQIIDGLLEGNKDLN